MQIFAHRGYPLVAPENTMPSFDAAVAHGAKAIEFDVTLSRDGVPFVIHDRTLDRTSNSQGIASQFDWSYLKNLDAGSWFSSQFAGTKLPLLEEVLSTYGQTVLLNIEIKKEAVSHRLKDGIEQKVLQLIQKYKLSESVIVSSFSSRAVKRLVKMSDGFEVALLKARPLRILPSRLIRRFQANALHLPLRGLREKEVQLAIQSNIPVRVYTVNDVEQFMRLHQMGVSGIFTDDVKKLSSAEQSLHHR